MDKYKTTYLKMLIIYIKTSSLREGLYQFAVLNGSGWAVKFFDACFKFLWGIMGNAASHQGISS